MVDVAYRHGEKKGLHRTANRTSPLALRLADLKHIKPWNIGDDPRQPPWGELKFTLGWDSTSRWDRTQHPRDETQPGCLGLWGEIGKSNDTFGLARLIGNSNEAFGLAAFCLYPRPTQSGADAFGVLHPVWYETQSPG